MNKKIAVGRALAVCFKLHLKPKEAMVYYIQGKTRMVLKSEAYGVYRNAGEYYKKGVLS